MNLACRDMFPAKLVDLAFQTRVVVDDFAVTNQNLRVWCQESIRGATGRSIRVRITKKFGYRMKLVFGPECTVCLTSVLILFKTME